MFKCPQCEANLPEVQHLKGTCPHCEASWDVDQPSEDSSDISQTIDIDQMNEPEEKVTKAEDAFDAGQTIDLEQPISESTNEDSNIGSTMEMPQEVQSSDQDNQQTVELEPVDDGASNIDQTVVLPVAGDGNSDDINQTVDLPSDNNPSSDIGQTLDLSDRDIRGTDTDRTLELPQGEQPDWDAGQTIDIPPGGSDLDGTIVLDNQGDGTKATIGSVALSASGVKEYWANADNGSATPMTSLKTATVSKGRDLGVEIPERMIVDKDSQSESSDYKIIDILGEGGMGTVYAANQLSVQRKVAIKTLKRGHDEKASDRAKFLTEAILTGFLDHPNIVPIHELGQTEDGSLFYSMKMVSGTPWNEIIRKKSEAENLEYLMRTADAMAFSHSRNIVHRDLKPENIMLGEYGEVLVMDWGLAVDLSRNEEFNMGGTPAYMAPEMAKGPLELIGKSSDIYLLGAILYEIVTGFPPHAAKNVTGCLMAAAQNKIVPSDSTNKLKEIALKAMSTSLKDRYNSVAGFQEAIREYQSRAQSMALSGRAAADLDQAKAEQSYELFSRAIFAFRDAIDLWTGNEQAITGLKNARLAYAQCAFENEDFDLGIQNLDASDPEESPLLEQLKLASNESKQRTKRLRKARLTAVGLILISLIGALGGIVVVNGYRSQAVELSEDLAGKNETLEFQKNQIVEDSKKIVEQNNALTEKNIEIADANKDIQEKAKKIEDDSKKILEQNNSLIEKNVEIANANKDIQEKAMKIEDDSKLIVNQNKELEVKQIELSKSLVATTKAKDIAEIAEKEATTQRKLAEFNSVFSSVGLAQSKIEANDIGRAVDLLGTVPVDYQGWEWRHLYHRCHADVPQIEANSSVTAIDVSKDGTRVIYGTDSGAVLLVDRNGKPIGKPLNIGPCSITAVQFSPNGSTAIIGSDHATKFLIQWDLKSSEAFSIDLSSILTRPSGAYHVNFVEFAANGTAYAGVNGYLIQVKDGNPSGLLAFSGAMSDLIISEENQTLIACGQHLNQGRAELIDIVTGARVAAPLIYPEPLVAGQYLDTQHVALGTNDGQLLLWDSRSSDSPKLISQLNENIKQLQYNRITKKLAAAVGSSINLWNWNEDLKRLTSYKTLRGHLDLATSCVFSDNGQIIISGSIDKKIRFWNPTEYRDELEFPQTQSVQHASFSSDGSLVVTGDVSGACRIFNRMRPNAVPQIFQEGDWQLENKEGFNVVYSSDGKFLCTQISGVGGFIWDTQSKRLVKHIPTKSESVAVTPIPNSSLIAFGDSTAGLLHIVNPVNGQVRQIDISSKGLSLGGKNLAVSPNGQNIVVAMNPRVDIHQLSSDLSSADKIWSAENGYEKGVEFIDDNYLALGFTSNNQGHLSVINIGEDKLESKMPVENHGKLIDFKVSPDRNSIAALFGRKTSVIQIWNPKSGETKITRLDASIQNLSYCADGKSLILTNATQVYLWNLQQQSPELLPISAKSKQIKGIECSPINKDELVVFYTNKDIEQWDLNKLKITARFNSSHRVVFTELIEDDTKLVSAHADGMLRIWNVANGQKIGQTNLGQKSIRGASRNGNQIALAANDGSVTVINLDSLQIDSSIDSQRSSANSVAWHSRENKNYLVVAFASGKLQWFDAKTGKATGAPFAETLFDKEKMNEHSGSFQHVTVSSNGKYLAATSSDKKIRIWVDFDPNDMSKSWSTSKDGHSATVTAAAFSKSGDRLVTGSEDSSLIVWLIDDQENQNSADSESEGEQQNKDRLLVREVLPLQGHRKGISSIVFSPDQQELLTSGDDNQSIVWLSAQPD